MDANPSESLELSVADPAQIGKSHKWRLLSLGLAATAVVVCTAAILSTLRMEAIAAANYNPGGGNVAILGGWNSVAYIIMALAAWHRHRRYPLNHLNPAIAPLRRAGTTSRTSSSVMADRSPTAGHFLALGR